MGAARDGRGGARLQVEDLHVHFRTARGNVRAVDGVSFRLEPGETLAVLGESGCGKTTLLRALLRLLPRNVVRFSGRILLDGEDVMSWSEEEFRRGVRWVKMSMVPQAAMNAFNPVLRVGDQVMEPLLVHRQATMAEAWERAVEAFSWVGIPADFLTRYPFELSGGMRQRAALAMALLTRPGLVLLDEPTSALDVLTQANIMNVLKRIKAEMGTTFIFVTHDVGTSSELADKVAVAYGGQLVEISDAARFYLEPLHPYAQRLMASVPTLRGKKALSFIPGRPPDLAAPPPGCRFADRCPARMDRCKEDPPMVEAEPGRQVKCWLYHEAARKPSAS